MSANSIHLDSPVIGLGPRCFCVSCQIGRKGYSSIMTIWQVAEPHNSYMKQPNEGLLVTSNAEYEVINMIGRN